MTKIRTLFGVASLALLGAALATTPADAKGKRKHRPVAAATVAVPATPAPESSEAARARLNAEQAVAAKAQVDANVAAQAAYDKALADEAARAAKEKADYDASMVKWRADVEACKGGDKTRCAKPAG